MQSVLRDARHALRLFARTPGFTFVAIATLALGIGAATAIYSVLHSTLLRPLPFADADRIVFAWGIALPERDIRGASHPEVMDWREGTGSLEHMGIYDALQLTIRAGDAAAERVPAETVSASYFDLLQVRPALGRTLQPQDERPGAAPVVVLSDQLWQSSFGGDPGILGRDLIIGTQAFSVIGVMPPSFRGISMDARFWTTLAPLAGQDALTRRGGRWLAAIAKLRPGMTAEAAQADIDRVAAALAAEYPDVNTDRGASIVSLRDQYLGDTRRLIVVLSAAVALLLLIACANVASLLLVRGSSRTRELAVRVALGASRARVARQLLSESLVLALAGGLVGIALAFWSLQLLLPLIPAGVLPPYADVRLAPAVLAIALALTTLTGLLAGVLPALGAVRTDLRHHIDDSGRHARRTQYVLVAAEIAVAVVLLLGAGLMMRSFQQQAALDPGFDPAGVVAARFSLPAASYPPERRPALLTSLEESLRGSAGITAVAFTSDAPLRGSTAASILRVPGDPELEMRFYHHRVSENYFDLLRVPVRHGRGFTSADHADAPAVAIVSEAMAARAWPGADPLGRRVRLGVDEAVVVGVAGNVRQRTLTADLLDPAEDPDVYFHYPQWPATGLDVLVRSDAPLADVAAAIRAALAAADPNLALAAVEPLTQTLRAQTAASRFGSLLLGTFGALALILACTGIYGVLAFMVGQRRRELAIRMALGATAGSLRRLVLQRGTIVVAAGLAGGIAAGLAAVRFLRVFLYDVSPADPLTIIVACTLLSGTALLASWIPAVRAARVQPQSTFRD